MAQFTRTKKLTDYAYSPTEPASEDAIRLQVDNSIQEVADIIYSTDAGKGASQVGHTLGGAYGTDVDQALQIIVATGAGGGIPDNSISDSKLSDTAGQIKDRVTTLDSAVVKKTGAQTIADVKTFSSSPIVPTPTTATQTANKGYADTQDALKVSKTGDTMTGVLTMEEPIVSTKISGTTNIKKVENVVSYDFNGTQIGTIKINLPSAWADSMIKIKIEGYDLNTNGFEIEVAGHCLTNKSWTEYSARVNGISPFSSVRVGYDATNPCILLGTLTTNLSYPKLVVSCMNGHIGWDVPVTGWTISLITSEAGITVSGTPRLQGYEPETTVISSGFVAGVTGSLRLKKYADGIVVANFSFTTSSTINVSVYTFPVGYRPVYASQLSFPNTNGAASSVTLNTDGTLVAALWPSPFSFNGTLVFATT